MEDDVTYLSRKIADEDALGRESLTSEAAEMHHQLAMLYRAQLNVVSRRSLQSASLLSDAE